MGAWSCPIPTGWQVSGGGPPSHFNNLREIVRLPLRQAVRNPRRRREGTPPERGSLASQSGYHWPDLLPAGWYLASVTDDYVTVLTVLKFVCVAATNLVSAPTAFALHFATVPGAVAAVDVFFQP